MNKGNIERGNTKTVFDQLSYGFNGEADIMKLQSYCWIMTASNVKLASFVRMYYVNKMTHN